MDMENIKCPYCAEEIKAEAKICKHCKSTLVNDATITSNSNKNKTTAGLLALFLGGLGAHKFYLGNIGFGILYLLFFWTWIPAILGLIEGIVFLTMNEKDFDIKYNKKNNKVINNNEKKDYITKEIKLGFDKGKNINISNGKGLFILIIILLIGYSMFQWITKLVIDDSSTINTQSAINTQSTYNSSKSCSILNSEILAFKTVPLQDCFLLDRKGNAERVKGNFKYGYSKDEAGTGFFVCDIFFDENDVVKDKNCYINNMNLKPLNDNL